MFDAPAGVPQDNTDDIASLASHPAAPHPAAGEPVSAATLDAMVGRAAQALKEMQREDGHWVFELEADATIPAEYVLLRHHLAEPEDLELERRIGNYLRRIQGDHGGWPLFHGGAFDISATVKAYFCLKMIGDSPDAPHMARAPPMSSPASCSPCTARSPGAACPPCRWRWCCCRAGSRST